MGQGTRDEGQGARGEGRGNLNFACLPQAGISELFAINCESMVILEILSAVFTFDSFLPLL